MPALRTIDVIVTVFVRLALAGLGAGLAYQNGRDLYADTRMYQVLGPDQVPMMAPFFVLHIGLTLVGMAIVLFAVVGLVKVIRQKLRSPTAVAYGARRPLTVTRIVAAAAFGLGAAFGVVTLGAGIVPMIEVTNLALNGVPGTATVTSIVPTAEEGIFTANYEFVTADGRRATGARDLGAIATVSAERSKTLDIVYLPNDPGQSEIASPDALQGVGYFALSRLGLLLVGIWGVWKNLRPEYDGQEAAPTTPMEIDRRPSPPPPPAPVSRAGAPARTFGRRGL